MTERYRGGRRRWNLKRRRNGRFARRASENPIVASNPMLEAAENPMSAAEYLIGGGSMIVGGFVAELADRFAATHALTMIQKPWAPGQPTTATADATAAATDPNGKIVYMDVPDSGAATLWSPYNGMKNGAAIAAPMGLKRWLVAGGVVVGPFVVGMPLAYYGHHKTAAFFNFLGFGGAVRTGVKALGDVFAFAFKGTALGKRLYDAEARAQALKSGDGSEAYLPSTGLGRANVSGKKLAGCGDGCDCSPCRQKRASQAQPPSAQQAPPPPPPPVQVAPQPVPVPVPPQGTQPPTHAIPGQLMPPSPSAARMVGQVIPRQYAHANAWARRDNAAE